MACASIISDCRCTYGGPEANLGVTELSLVSVCNKGFHILGKQAVLYSVELFRGCCIDIWCDCFTFPLKWICTEILHCNAYEEGPKKRSMCTPNSGADWVMPGRRDEQQVEAASETLGSSMLFLRKQVVFCLPVTILNDALFFSSLTP